MHGNKSNTFEQRHGYKCGHVLVHTDEYDTVTSTCLYKGTTMRIHDYTDDSKAKVCEPYKLHENAFINLFR